jgi:hypothetical protein
LEDDLAEARRLHETFGLPVGAIPGNHDVGEAHDVPGSKEVPISAERRERYLRYFAIDAMLLASELGVAAGQLDFLARAVGSSNDYCGYACSFVRVPGLQRLDIADFAAAFGKAV